MSILNKEIVGKDSPAWVGFQYALLSLACIFVFSTIISLIFAAIFPDVFGFYFTTFSQEMRLSVVSTFFGTLVSARLFGISKKMKDSAGLSHVSVIWFTVFQILILLPLFWDAIFFPNQRHYGLTAVDNLKESVPLAFIMVIGFSLLNWFLKKK